MTDFEKYSNPTLCVIRHEAMVARSTRSPALAGNYVAWYELAKRIHVSRVEFERAGFYDLGRRLRALGDDAIGRWRWAQWLDAWSEIGLSAWFRLNLRSRLG